MRTVGQPLLHAQEVQKLLFVGGGGDQVEIVLRQGPDWRHHLENGGHDLARQIAEGPDQPPDVLVFQTAGPQIDEAVRGIAVGLIAVKIDGRDRQDQIPGLFRMQGGVQRAEHAAFANAEKRYPVDPCAPADMFDTVIEIPIHIVIEGPVLVRPVRMTPVDDVEIDAARQQIAHQGAVLLQVRHRIAANQPVHDQHRPGTDRRLRQRVIVVERHLVLPQDKGLRRRTDVDVLLLHAGKRLGRRREFPTELQVLLQELAFETVCC